MIHNTIKHHVLSLLVLCVSLFAWTANAAQAPTQAVPAINLPSLAPMLDKTMKATVNIAVQGTIPAEEILEEEQNNPSSADDNSRGKARKFEALGSGVIIDANKGYIITNEHVIRNATTITVTLNDGSRLNAKLIGSDEDSDIAVLKIKSKKLPSIAIGNSDALHVGDFVVAVGNPFGLNSLGNSQTATFGIISALQRSDLNIEGIENFIQTDAAINPGNSGGALLNMKGELIGINTAILAPYAGNVGIGFAIPINMAVDVMNQIIKYGSIHRGLMGVFVQPLTPELSLAFGLPEDTQGALVSQVNMGSPAEKAGLQAGDIILQINKSKITDASQVKNIISLLRVGSQAQLQVLRNKKVVTLNAVVTDAKQHEKQLQAKNPFLYGLALRDFSQESPFHGRVIGVQVVGVAEVSSGWRAGIRPGDVIIEANQQSVQNLNDLQKIASQAKTELLLHVLRGQGSLFLVLK